ncbi:unnamed protein product [Eretmochelys imbricata]
MSQAWQVAGDHAELISRVTMMESQNRKRAPAWTEREGLKDRGHNRDPKQCSVKLKELRQAYQKTREANGRSGSEPQTCRFYDELHAILGGSATTTPAMLFDSFNGDGGNTEAGFWDEEDDEEEEDFSSHSLKTCYKYLNQTSWSFAAIIQALNGDLWSSSDFPHDGNVMAELCLYITDPTEDISYQAREGIYQFLMNQRERETPERS